MNSKWDTHVLPRLADIEDWISKGASEKDVCSALNISQDTWIVYKKEHSELSECLTRARAKSVLNVKNALYESAIGFTIKTKKSYIRKDKETGKAMQYIEETERHEPPNPQSIAMYLRNNDSEWKDRDSTSYDFKAMELELKKLQTDSLIWHDEEGGDK